MSTLSTDQTAKTRNVQSFKALLLLGPTLDRESVARLLRSIWGGGLELAAPDGAEEAIELLNREKFDVVLLDAGIPERQRILQAGGQGKGTAVLLLAGAGMEAAAAEALEQGAEDYLAMRDLTGAALERAVSRALRRVQLERQNSRTMEQLRRTNDEMDHFVRAISHDMGVNFILLEHSVRELKKSCGDSPLKKMTESFAHVESSLRESRRFLDDLVKLTQTGSIHMEPARVELPAVVSAVLFDQEPLLAERNIAVAVDPELPAVYCNEARVKQVFTNLIRNAARHGCDRQRPMIEIDRREPPAAKRGERMAWIRLYDNGPGIPCEHHEEIFLPGRRLTSAHSSGSGMGLAIVKKIVTHYGGTIQVDPQTRQGTAFLFSLPLCP